MTAAEMVKASIIKVSPRFTYCSFSLYKTILSLKRVFAIDIETCTVCGGSMKVIACIEDPMVIKKILTHLRGNELDLGAAGLPQSMTPPQGDLFS